MTRDVDSTRRAADTSRRTGPTRRPTGHTWTVGTRRDQPVLVCTNRPCPIVWWPDRNEPRSTCNHQAEGASQ